MSRNPSKAEGVAEVIRLAQCDVRDEDALNALFQAEAPFDALISAATGGERAIGPFLEVHACVRSVYNGHPFNESIEYFLRRLSVTACGWSAGANLRFPHRPHPHNYCYSSNTFMFPFV